MGMIVVGMQGHRVPMLELPFVQGEGLDCPQHLLRGSTGWHGKDDVVHELRGFPSAPDGAFRLALERLDIQVPVLDRSRWKPFPSR